MLDSSARRMLVWDDVELLVIENLLIGTKFGLRPERPAPGVGHGENRFVERPRDGGRPSPQGRQSCLVWSSFMLHPFSGHADPSPRPIKFRPCLPINSKHNAAL